MKQYPLDKDEKLLIRQLRRKKFRIWEIAHLLNRKTIEVKEYLMTLSKRLYF